VSNSTLNQEQHKNKSKEKTSRNSFIYFFLKIVLWHFKKNGLHDSSAGPTETQSLNSQAVVAFPNIPIWTFLCCQNDILIPPKINFIFSLFHVYERLCGHFVRKKNLFMNIWISEANKTLEKIFCCKWRIQTETCDVHFSVVVVVSKTEN